MPKNPQQILESMLALQQRLNDETNGPGWEGGHTREGRMINWRRCIYMECAELLDSFPWKHWKALAAPINWDNVRIELVDIWHFILSLLLEEGVARGLSHAGLAEDVVGIRAFARFCDEPASATTGSSSAAGPVGISSEIHSILNDIEFIIHKCSGFRLDLGDLLAAYFALGCKCGLNLASLNLAYLGKNALNAFRQDQGYKEGSYRKLWAGREDNEVLNEILHAHPGADYATIYAELERRYLAG